MKFLRFLKVLALRALLKVGEMLMVIGVLALIGALVWALMYGVGAAVVGMTGYAPQTPDERLGLGFFSLIAAGFTVYLIWGFGKFVGYLVRTWKEL